MKQVRHAGVDERPDQCLRAVHAFSRAAIGDRLFVRARMGRRRRSTCGRSARARCRCPPSSPRACGARRPRRAPRPPRPRRARSAPRARPARPSSPRRARCGRRRRPAPRPGRRPRRATSGSARAVDGTESSCRPPWFETTMPSTPASAARRASSGSSTPLTTSRPAQLLAHPGDVVPGHARVELPRRPIPGTRPGVRAFGTARLEVAERQRLAADRHVADPCGMGREVEAAPDASPTGPARRRRRCACRGGGRRRPPGRPSGRAPASRPRAHAPSAPRRSRGRASRRAGTKAGAGSPAPPPRCCRSRPSTRRTARPRPRPRGRPAPPRGGRTSRPARLARG